MATRIYVAYITILLDCTDQINVSQPWLYITINYKLDTNINVQSDWISLERDLSTHILKHPPVLLMCHQDWGAMLNDQTSLCRRWGEAESFSKRKEQNDFSYYRKANLGILDARVYAWLSLHGLAPLPINLIFTIVLLATLASSDNDFFQPFEIATLVPPYNFYICCCLCLQSS